MPSGAGHGKGAGRSPPCCQLTCVPALACCSGHKVWLLPGPPLRRPSPAQLLRDLLQLLLRPPQLDLQVVARGAELRLQLLQPVRGVGQPLAQLALLLLQGTATTCRGGRPRTEPGGGPEQLECAWARATPRSCSLSRSLSLSLSFSHARLCSDTQDFPRVGRSKPSAFATSESPRGRLGVEADPRTLPVCGGSLKGPGTRSAVGPQASLGSWPGTARPSRQCHT